MLKIPVARICLSAPSSIWILPFQPCFRDHWPLMFFKKAFVQGVSSVAPHDNKKLFSRLVRLPPGHLLIYFPSSTRWTLCRHAMSTGSFQQIFDLQQAPTLCSYSCWHLFGMLQTFQVNCVWMSQRCKTSVVPQWTRKKNRIFVRF